MITNPRTHLIRENLPFRCKFRALAFVLTFIILGGLAFNAAASGNILQDGDFNGAYPGGWTTWTWNGGWVGQSSTASDEFDGTPIFYCGGGDNNGPQKGGFYQYVSAVPGVPYTISCDSAVNAWWWPDAIMRMTFVDTNGNSLLTVETNCAAAITAYDVGLPWSNYTFTATSPANTAQIKVEFTCDGHGTVRFDNAVLTAPVDYPVITNLYPDGSFLMQGTNAFTFTAIGASTPIDNSGIQVVVNGVDVSSNLSITGSSLNKQVSYSGISSNNNYTVYVRVANTDGLWVARTVSFDTFGAGDYTWEAEDWDYSGGLFIDNPQIDAYSGLNSVADVDYHKNPNSDANFAYRSPAISGTAFPQTEVTGDTKRIQYVNTNDYDVGWFNPGEWLNYTRTYPAGVFNVYARMASPGSATINLSQVTSGQGSTNQTLASLGNFAQTGGLGWGTYSWVPLTDSSGNLVKVTLGGVSTLRVTTGGGANFQFLTLVAANTNLPVIAGVYPDGATQFQPTNTLSFSVASAAGINPGSIAVTLSITNVALHYTTNLTSANGLTIGGTANNRTVSFAGLVSNALYSATIVVTDINNNTATASWHFDTYAPVLTWEAEDYDYNGGQFLDNPAVDAYLGRQGIEGIDFHDSNASGPRLYRTQDAMSSDVVAEIPRSQYVAAGTNDYSVGYFVGGEWVNYTRTFPAGTYNVYGRFAAGGGTSSLSLGVVTNGAGTSSQGVQQLGTFTVDGTGGWGTYAFTPLRDQFGNLAQVTLNGATTVRIQRTSGADANMNFFMILPAVTTLPTITQVTPLGWFQSTNTLSFIAASTAGIATSNIVVTLNGLTISNLVFSGSSTSWNVSCPLAPNAIYTAVITVTDANGAVAATSVNFDTFSPYAYTWEAEDYDYNGGQFIDNPQVNAYFGVSGIAGTDFFRAGSGGNPVYRADAVGTEACGDLVRPQYAGTSYTDYDVGWTSTGDWWNYTRTYPAGTFNVYLRAARGDSGTVTMGMRTVVSGWGTSSQTTANLGAFTVPSTGGWQTYAWSPLKDNGNLVAVSLGGTNTLRLTDGGANINFLLLAPALMLNASAGGGNLHLSFGTQSGFNYSVLYKTNLSDSAWTVLNTVAGDNTVKTISDSMTGTSRFYLLQAH